MRLECKLKRKPGTDVDVNGRLIQFRPVDPTRPDSPHVAEVSRDEAEVFFNADSRVYVPFDAEAVAPLTVAPVVPAASAPSQDGIANALGAHVDGTAAALVEAQATATEVPSTPAAPVEPTAPVAAATAQGDSNADGVVSVSELRRMIAEGASKERLQSLLDAENAKTEGRRASFCDIIERALKS